MLLATRWMKDEHVEYTEREREKKKVIKDQETKLTSINTSDSQNLPIILQASTFKNATKEFQFSQKNSHIKQKDSKTDWKQGIHFFTVQDETAECQL